MYTRAIRCVTQCTSYPPSLRISPATLVHYPRFLYSPKVQGRLRESRQITTAADGREGVSYIPPSPTPLIRDEGAPETSSTYVVLKEIPLPTLPPAPKYPCPLLTQDEIDIYLRPLYKRKWGVTARLIERTTHKENVSQLTGVFFFKSNEHAQSEEYIKKFVDRIAGLVKSEKVSPSFLVLFGSTTDNAFV